MGTACDGPGRRKRPRATSTQPPSLREGITHLRGGGTSSSWWSWRNIRMCRCASILANTIRRNT